MRKLKEPTCTSTVYRVVQIADDFVTAKQVVERSTLTPTQVGVALSYLKVRHAMDCFESGGKLWWFTTPDKDDRTRHHDERQPETKKRKERKKKAVQPN